jgi:hypothetical protein
MSKIPVKVGLRNNPIYVECEIHGTKLRVYRDGRIDRYASIKTIHYDIGWNIVSTTPHKGNRYLKIVLGNTAIGFKNVKQHRIIYWSWNQDTFDLFDNKIEIDHIDRNTYNNELSNLRPATRSENSCNVDSRGLSGIKNITIRKRKLKPYWEWYISVRKGDEKRYRTAIGGMGNKPLVYQEIPDHILEIRDRMVKDLHGDYYN